ncbi:MAG: hypothetical protein LBN42_01460 [Oscillospiraceae bacterium]|jgi:hypothetical protein|nr:hypothetical protein [Oscillospiraceae bacterium]
MNLTISKNDVKRLIVAAFLLIFIASLLYVYLPFTDTANEYEDKLTRANAEITRLKLLDVELDESSGDIQKLLKQTADTIALFPSRMKNDDIIRYVDGLETEVNFKATSISFSSPFDVSSISVYNAEKDTTVAYKIRGVTVTLNIGASYADLKKLLVTIRSELNPVSINTLNFAQSTTSGELAAILTLTKYYAESDNSAIITTPDISAAEKGNFNPFGAF